MMCRRAGQQSSQGLRKHLFSRKSNLPTDGGEEWPVVLPVGTQLGRLDSGPSRQGSPTLRPREVSAPTGLPQGPEAWRCTPAPQAEWPRWHHRCALPSGFEGCRIEDSDGHYTGRKQRGLQQPLGTVETFLVGVRQVWLIWLDSFPTPPPRRVAQIGQTQRTRPGLGSAPGSGCGGPAPDCDNCDVPRRGQGNRGKPVTKQRNSSPWPGPSKCQVPKGSLTAWGQETPTQVNCCRSLPSSGPFENPAP